jgi:hypothetical protein
MKRHRRRFRKVKWTRKAVLGFSAAVLVILALSQVSNFLSFWIWGPDTGYRSAGITSGHYERQHPAILSDMPMIGVVFVGAGERLVFDYDLEVEEGTAAFSIWKWPTPLNRPHKVGPKRIRVSGTGQVEYTPLKTGFYRIYMYAHRLQGAVSVEWRTEDRRAFADRAEER